MAMDTFEREELNELEQLRSDYELLKSKIDSQEIVNDRLLRQTMKSNVRNIDRVTLVQNIAAVIVIICAPLIFHYNPIVNASWWFVAGTVVMMLVCIFFNWKYNHKVSNANLANCDLREFVTNVKYLKDKWKGWIKWGVTMLVIWFGWLVVEVLMHSEDKILSYSIIIGMLLGGVLGGILGMRMQRKVIENCDEMISQIDK